MVSDSPACLCETVWNKESCRPMRRDQHCGSWGNDYCFVRLFKFIGMEWDAWYASFELWHGTFYQQIVSIDNNFMHALMDIWTMDWLSTGPLQTHSKCHNYA